MSIQDNTALIALAKLEMGGSKDLLDDAQWDRAANKAAQELGWTLPLSDSSKEFWITERCVRHALGVLMTEAAHKFKYNQINLQQRYANYADLVKKMDKDFKEAIDENPGLFSSANPYDFFGTYISNGFSYDGVGQDTTYADDNRVGYYPKVD